MQRRELIAAKDGERRVEISAKILGVMPHDGRAYNTRSFTLAGFPGLTVAPGLVKSITT